MTLGALAVLVLLYLGGRLLTRRGPSPGEMVRELGVVHSWWVLPYFGGLWVLSGLGPRELGGNGTIPFFVDMGLVAAESLLVLRTALASSVPASEIVRIMEALRESPPAGP